jgi:copper chaperone CopZ
MTGLTAAFGGPSAGTARAMDGSSATTRCARGCAAGCRCCDPAAREARGEMRRVTVPIFGLGCGGSGADTAERALERTPGVRHAYVNPATEMAYVEFDACACSAEALKDAIRSAGLRPGHPSQR